MKADYQKRITDPFPGAYEYNEDEEKVEDSFKREMDAFFDWFSPHCNDWMLWRLQERLAEKIEARKRELIGLGVNDWRTTTGGN